MNSSKIFGALLIIAGCLCYFFKPFENDVFDFLSGVAVAIGLSILLGWFKTSK